MPQDRNLPNAAYRAWLVMFLLFFAVVIGQEVVRERNRRRLAAGEDRFSGLAEGGRSIVWETTVHDRRPVFVSSNIRSLLGIEPATLTSREAAIEHVHPDDRETFGSTVERALAGDSDLQEVRLHHADGRWIWFRVHSQLVPARRGEPAVVRGVAIEITGERLAREAAREEEDRYRRLFDAAQFGVMTVDGRERVIRSINPAFARSLGYEPDELEGQPATIISGEASPVFGDARLPLLMEGVIPAFRTDAVVSHRDGSRRYLDIVIVRDKPADDGAFRALGLVQDRTEAIAAERELAESEARYRAMFDIAFGGVSISADGVRLEVNPGMEAIYGMPAEDLVGRSIHELLAPGTSEEAAAAIRENRAGRVVATIVRKDGTLREVEGVAAQIVYLGRPARITAIRDVTDERRREEEVRQSQKLEAIGRLAGGIAHDFNNLLQVMSGSTALALRSLHDEPVLRSELGEVTAAVGRAAELTRQLLSFARNQPVTPTLVDVNDVVSDVRRLLDRVIGHEIELDIALDERRTASHLDRAQLEQVLINLATNARDAMPGGGRLGITTEVRGGGEDGSEAQLLLRVTDDGAGMDDGVRSRIFEPFFTTKEAGKGTGLGLSTVYGIITRAGGTIVVLSSPARGTTFEIGLPCRIGAPPPLRPEDRPMEGVVTGRVLLVDDDVAVLRVLEQILSAAGFAVRSATTGGEALEAARGGGFDLLVTDLSMPGMTGPDLALGVRALIPEIPVLFVSGNPHQYEAQGQLGLAGADIVVKPFSAEALVERARALLAVAAAVR